ncbi:MAG: hypothetical protein ACUVX8_08990 [Candidatus Zipacnadales bacterium]
MRTLKLIVTIVVGVTLLGCMWYQAFMVTGVTTEVRPAEVERPVPPPPPELSPLPRQQANIKLFARIHPIWSPFE